MTVRRRATTYAGGLVAAGVMLGGAASASAATLHAAPIGAIGTGDCSSPANACLLPDALSRAGDGDQVLLARGTYRGSGELKIAAPSPTASIAVGAEPDATSRPGLNYTGGVRVGSKVTLQDVDVSLNGAALTLDSDDTFTSGAFLDRVFVAGTNAASGLVVAPGNARIRASVLFNSSPGGIALAASPNGRIGNIELRSSTIVANRPKGVALKATPSASGGYSAVRAYNTIFRGSDDTGDGGYDVWSDPQGQTNVVLRMTNAAFSGLRTRGLSDDPRTTVYTDGQVYDAPTFVDAVNGNFREAAESKTIDAGAAIESQSPAEQLDLVGNQRPANGTAPDVGAYERVTVPPASDTPTGTAGQTTATITTTVAPNSARTTARLDYGPTNQFGPTYTLASSTESQTVTSLGPRTLTYTLSGLKPNTQYTVRGILASDAGTSTGPDATFTTLPADAPPTQTTTVTPTPSPPAPTVYVPPAPPPAPIIGPGYTITFTPEQVSFPDIVITTETDPDVETTLGPFDGATQLGGTIDILRPILNTDAWYDVFTGQKSSAPLASPFLQIRAKKKRTRYAHIVLGRGHLTLKAHKKGKLKIKLPKAVLKTLRSVHQVKATLTIVATDRATGKSASVKKPFTLKYRKTNHKKR